MAKAKKENTQHATVNGAHVQKFLLDNPTLTGKAVLAGMKVPFTKKNLQTVYMQRYGLVRKGELKSLAPNATNNSEKVSKKPRRYKRVVKVHYTTPAQPLKNVYAIAELCLNIGTDRVIAIATAMKQIESLYETKE